MFLLITLVTTMARSLMYTFSNSLTQPYSALPSLTHAHTLINFTLTFSSNTNRYLYPFFVFLLVCFRSLFDYNLQEKKKTPTSTFFLPNTLLSFLIHHYIQFPFFYSSLFQFKYFILANFLGRNQCFIANNIPHDKQKNPTE